MGLDIGIDFSDPFGKKKARQNELARRDAKTFVQDRVADAKAAGVHPLFALGAQYNAPPIVPEGGGINASMSVNRENWRDRQEANYEKGRAMARQQEADQLVRDQARASIAKDEALRQVYLSESALNHQRLRHSGNDVAGVTSPREFQQGVVQTPGGVVEVVPNPNYTTRPGDPDTGAGRNPLFSRYQYGDRKDQFVLLPTSQGGSSEALESVIGTVAGGLKTLAEPDFWDYAWWQGWVK